MSDCKGRRSDGIGSIMGIVLLIAAICSCQANERLDNIEKHLGIHASQVQEVEP